MVFASSVLWFLKRFSVNRNRMLDELCEYHCDRSTIKVLQNEMDAKTYFNHIVDCSRSLKYCEKSERIGSGLNKSKVQIKRRIRYIKMYNKTVRKPVISIIFSTICFVSVITSMSFVTGYGLSIISDCIYRKTEDIEFIVSEKERVNNAKISDYNGEHDASLCFVTGDIINESITVDSTCPLKPSVRYVSNSIMLEGKQNIAISGIMIPSTELCRVGIIRENDGDITYVESKAAFDHVMKVPEGKYRVFIQNKGEQEMMVSMQITYN